MLTTLFSRSYRNRKISRASLDNTPVVSPVIITGVPATTTAARRSPSRGILSPVLNPNPGLSLGILNPVRSLGPNLGLGILNPGPNPVRSLDPNLDLSLVPNLDLSPALSRNPSRRCR